MNHYFINSDIVSFASEISEAIEVSSNFEDRFKMPVPLTAEQAAFYEANKTASIYEVFNCALTVTPVMPEPTSAEKRKMEYQMRKCVTWQENWGDETYTVNEAKERFTEYRSEGEEEKASTLQAAIKTQKEIIRAEFQD